MLLATVGTTASAEQWATCKFTFDEERRCVEVRVEGVSNAAKAMEDWCLSDLSSGVAMIETGRTCPNGPSCTRDTGSLRAYSERSCKPRFRADLNAHFTVCTYTIPSHGPLIASTYVDYGGSGLQSFCKSQGGRFKRN